MAIVQGVLEVLVLRVVVEIAIEVGVVDGIYIHMSVGARKGFSKERVMPLGVSGMGGVKVL